MGWINYYRLLEKYDGDLSKATKKELDSAATANPNNPIDAKRIAQEKFSNARPKINQTQVT